MGRDDMETSRPTALRREAERSLWLHEEVARRLERDPEVVMAAAHGGLDRLLARHSPRGTGWPWLDQWRRTLDEGPAAVLAVLTSRDEPAVEMRQNSPFSAVLDARERTQLLREFYQRYDGRHRVDVPVRGSRS